jgi:hypothetical protein
MKTILSCLATLALGACAGSARSVETYRADTRALLETRSAAIKTCYDKTLAGDPSAKGIVAVTFTVEKKTGEVKKAMLDSAKTSASGALSECVLQAIAGLKLAPPDANDGEATFVYELAPGST